MTIPVLVPPPSPGLSRPYVTAGMFKGFPHWLDLDDLIPQGAGALQDDALNDTLLQASDWAMGVCEDMRLDAHWVQNESRRTRAGGSGRLYIKPNDIPLRAVTALSYGWDPSAMTPASLPLSSQWIEDGREFSFVPSAGLNFTGPAIQFGPAPSPGMLTYVTWSYIAGFPSTYFSAPVASGASSVTVADPAGILPGDTLRIYDPGQSEALTVSGSYVPAMPTVPPTATAVPLAASTQHAHAASTGVTGMPRKILQAVIAYAVALLMREDVSEEEPVSGFGPAARSTVAGRGGAAAGIVNDAYEWLAPYRPTLRS